MKKKILLTLLVIILLVAGAFFFVVPAQLEKRLNATLNAPPYRPQSARASFIRSCW